MLIENFKLADGASIVSRLIKVGMNTVLHKEMLKITGQNHNVLVHFRGILAKLTGHSS
jgi:hypothetical protein